MRNRSFNGPAGLDRWAVLHCAILEGANAANVGIDRAVNHFQSGVTITARIDLSDVL